METTTPHGEAWEGIRNGFHSGRLAHAYIIVGSPRGNALRFSEAFLKLLFCQGEEKPCSVCTACRLVDAHKHVDTLWIEPQSKSRKILVEDINNLISRISQTSFEGGWKAGILLSAECMNIESANKLLKTLEEPPPRTILLAVTDSPQSLLPTIISRCQKIVLPEDTGQVAAAWEAPLMELMRELPPKSGLGAMRLAGMLKSVFDEVKTGIADEVYEGIGEEAALDETRKKSILEARTNARLKEVQTEVFRVMLDWHRDLLMLASDVDKGHLVFSGERQVLTEQAGQHTQASAVQAIQTIEEMRRRLDRNLPDIQVFEEAFRKLVRRS